MESSCTETDQFAEEFLRELEMMPPKCFGSLAHLLASKEKMVLSECDRCRQRDSCSELLLEDLVRSREWPCIGAGPHEVHKGQSCGYVNCGLMDQCSKMHDLFYDAHATEPISKGREAVLMRLRGETPAAAEAPIPAPTTPAMAIVVPKATAEKTGSGAVVPVDERLPRAVAAAKISTCIAAPVEEFPFDQNKVVAHRESIGHLSDSELLNLVKLSSEGTNPAALEARSYSAVRELYLAASMELNQRGATAPYFRLRKRLAVPLPKDLETYARDVQLIDLHWLSLHGNPFPTDEWLDIFAPEGLNIRRAWLFACHKAKMHFKSQFLGLGGLEEHCMSMLRSEETATLWKRLHEGSGSSKRKLKLALERPGVRRNDSVEYLFDAHRALVACYGDRGTARSLMRLMGYTEPAPATFNRLVTWLSKAGLALPECSRML